MSWSIRRRPPTRGTCSLRKRLDSNAFERALTLINFVRPDGSKYKASEWRVSRASPRAQSFSTRSCAPAPRAPPAMDMKFVVYLNFISVYIKFFVIKNY